MALESAHALKILHFTPPSPGNVYKANIKPFTLCLFKILDKCMEKNDTNQVVLDYWTFTDLLLQIFCLHCIQRPIQIN